MNEIIDKPISLWEYTKKGKKKVNAEIGNNYCQR